MWFNRYENQSMRKNPIVSSKLEIGGRPMPSWFSSSLVNQVRGVTGFNRPHPPPLPIEPPPHNDNNDEEESEYEEIEHRYNNYANMNSNTNSKRTSGAGSHGNGSCSLCGNATPLVSCEMCNNQVFCGSCNDMYHRHPRRHNHTRKLLQSSDNRPPLPYKSGSYPQAEAPVTPQPPPRRNKRFGLRSTNTSPTPVAKFSFDPMGSLKRFVGVGGNPNLRPLPLPPTQKGTSQLPIKSGYNRFMAEFPRSTSNKQNLSCIGGPAIHQSNDRRQSAPFSPNLQNNRSKQMGQRSGSIANPRCPSPFNSSNDDFGQGIGSIPVTVMELGNARQHTLSKLPAKYCLPPSRDSGWDDEDEEESLPRNQRAFSVSATNLQQFHINSSSNASHFATLQRRASAHPPSRPPPPVPPRDFSLVSSWNPIQMYPAVSAFELDRAGTFAPMMMHHGFQPEHQKPLNSSFPDSNTMRRVPIQTMSHHDQSPFGWNTQQSTNPCDQQHFDQPERRTAEIHPSYGNQIELSHTSDRGNSKMSSQESTKSSGFAHPLAQRPPTPKKPTPLPSLPSKPEPEYYSGDDGVETVEPSNPTELDSLTENPEGPWACEHCTFINPKSTRVCTVCCKTPIHGYYVVSSSERKLGKRVPAASIPIENELEAYIESKFSPVVQSKLSFSNSKSQPAQKINLSVEKLRKQTLRPPPPTAYEAESESESDSDLSSQEIVTEKLRYMMKENKSNTLTKPKKGSSQGSNQDTDFETLQWSPRPIFSPSTKTSQAGKFKEFVDTGTGDYSIIDTHKMAKDRTKRLEDEEKAAQTVVERNTKAQVVEHKNSIGTSPPPQTISTQTYEELPATKLRQKSISKTSLQSSSVQSRETSPPRVIEMSEKALRYARRAQQQSQLKRSMSTHLTSTPTSGSNEPWLVNQSRQNHHEGRHLYRTTSRQSLASDTRSLPISGPPSRDISPPQSRGRYCDDLRRFEPPSWDRFPSPGDYFASIEDLVARKRRESIKSQEFELSRLLKEAEESSYTPEDLQVGLRMCGGDRNPIKWLQENWSNMVETVQTLATKYGRDKGQEQNEVGTISPPEAKEALRLHRGNVWAAVTECVEQRRKKFLELQSRGTFLREDILTALTANQGNMDAAYVELSKAQLKPFLMRIWGPPSGKDNESIPPRPQTPQKLPSTCQNQPQVYETSEKISSTRVQNETVLLEKVLTPTDLVNDDILENKLNFPEPINSDLTTCSDASEQLKSKSDGEDETFYDLEPLPSHSMSDGEVEVEGDESEANVSNFIQNYEIPPPPPTPNYTFDQSNLFITGDSTRNEPDVIMTEFKLGMSGTNPNELPTTSNINSISTLQGLNPTEMKQIFDEKNTVVASPQSLASLTKAVNVIAEKIGILLTQQQQNLSSSTDSKNTMILENVREGNEIEKVGGGESDGFVVGESNQGSLDITTESTNLVLMKEKEIQVLKEIYRDEFKVLKELVLPIEEMRVQNNQTFSMIPPQGQIEKVKEPFDRKSKTSKLYEVFGNFAGSFLRGSKSRIIQDSKSEENVYETVAVSNGNMEMKYQNEIQPDMLRENNTPTKMNVFQKQVSNFDDSLDFKLNRKDYFEIPEMSNQLLTNESNEVHQIKNSLEDLISEEDDGIGGFDRVDETPMDFNKINKISSESGENLDFGSDESQHDLEEYRSDDEEESYSDNNEDEFDNNYPNDGQVYEGVNFEHNSSNLSQLEDNQPDQSVPEPLSLDTVYEQQKPSLAFQNQKNRIDVAQYFLKSGQVNSIEKAQLVLKLMDMNFTEEDSVHAANECSSLYTAISFLQQDCLLCAGKFSAKEMISMLRCKHCCCRTCASEYFMVQIRDHSIIDATCPFCKEPSNLSEEDQASDYFSHLEIVLKDLLSHHFYEMFGRKLRDWTLAKTPNFKWCSKCSSGFITEPLQTHLVCPDCNAVTCAICLEPWDKVNHQHRDRTTTQVFCDENSSEAFPKSVIEYLNENNIDCPRCHYKFALARGGCMHLTCSQCRYEFCSGCSAPFAMGLRCKENLPFCAKLGLHAHHPRNCLFYLRDKEPALLIKLLKDYKIKVITNTETFTNQNTIPLASPMVGNCKVSIQKETEEGFLDDICGQEVSKECTDICQTHYIEYLGLLVWENQLDPIPILNNDDLETIVKRSQKRMPPKPYGTSESDYRTLLLKVIADEIPL